MGFKFLDRARQSITTGGTGDLVMGGALALYQTFYRAGAVAGDTFPYCIIDNNQWEIGVGKLTAVGMNGSVSRIEVSQTSAGNQTPLNISTGANVSAVYRAQDLSVVTRIDALVDVAVDEATTQNGYALTWSVSQGKWVAQASGGGGSLSGLADVSVVEGVGIDGYSLVWDNGSSLWVAANVGGGGGSTTLDALTDVNVTEGSGINGYSLVWDNGTSKWVAALNLKASNNLSDVPTPATARTNLGLGSMATQASSAVSISGGIISGVTLTGHASLDLLASNDLSDVASASTARTHLGLGSIATQAASSVVITGGTMTGVTITGHASLDLAAASNLSDLASATTARTNLGLGTMATQAASAVAITGGTITGVTLPTTDLTGTLAAGQEPAHTGDMTNTAGSLATVVGAIGGKAVSLGGALTLSGTFGTTFTVTATTAVTLPTSGTLATVANSAQVANNLSDLASASTARTNLGLGTMATQAASAVAITGGTMAGVTITGHSSLDLAAASNLSDLASASTSRTNLGLDTMATQAASAVAITGGTITGVTFPAQALSGLTDVNVTEGVGINGFSLTWDNGTSRWIATNVSGGGSSTLATLSDVNVTEGSGINGFSLVWDNGTSKWIAVLNLKASNNLSDVTTPATARTNLGLDTMATQAASAIAITGGTMTGVTLTGHASLDLAAASNLSDLASATTARTNLGLGTMATQAASAVAITGGTISGVTLPASNLTGTLAAGQEPAHTGDMTNTAGSLATTVGAIGGKAVTLGGAFTISGAFGTTLTVSATTALTLPTSGTLATVAASAQVANNLSDLASAATSRTNLGLGTMATQAASSVAITGGTISGVTLPASNLTGTLAAGQEPAHTGDMTNTAGSLATTVGAIGGKAVTLGGAFTISGAFGTTLTVSATTALTLPTSGTLATVAGSAQVANNLSDLANAGTARTNLGLGTMATQAASSVAITGGTMSGVTITGSASLNLLKSSNLSDVASAATSRTNLGLDTMSTQAASAVAITGGTIAGATTIGGATITASTNFIASYLGSVAGLVGVGAGNQFVNYSTVVTATTPASFSANKRIQLNIAGVTYFLPVATASW